jgi:hypothetical protein
MAAVDTAFICENCGRKIPIGKDGVIGQ